MIFFLIRQVVRILNCVKFKSKSNQLINFQPTGSKYNFPAKFVNFLVKIVSHIKFQDQCRPDVTLLIQDVRLFSSTHVETYFVNCGNPIPKN